MINLKHKTIKKVSLVLTALAGLTFGGMMSLNSNVNASVHHKRVSRQAKHGRRSLKKAKTKRGSHQSQKDS